MTMATGSGAPLMPMYTLGHKFAPANIHAGGLRFHGAGSIVSQALREDGYIEAVDIKQTDGFQGGVASFARTEGIIPAHESNHAIAAAIHEALKAKEQGEKEGNPIQPLWARLCRHGGIRSVPL